MCNNLLAGFNQYYFPRRGADIFLFPYLVLYISILTDLFGSTQWEGQPVTHYNYQSLVINIQNNLRH